MNLIDRYLGKTILSAILMVLFVIAGIEVFIMLIPELRNIGHNHYTVLSALIYVLLNLPDQIYQLFPMIGLLGMLMAFGLLANHSELVILQAAGLSPVKITFSALKTVIILLLLMSFVGEVIAPKTNVIANNYKDKLMKSSNDPTVVAYDLWLHMTNDYLHIHEMTSQNILRGISWYHFDNENNLLQANIAEGAVYQNGQWIADHIQQTTFNPESITTHTQTQAPWPLSIPPYLLLDSTQSPNNLSLHALHQSLQFHKHMHSENSVIQLAFWRKIMQPIASLVMILLAIPFIFGPLRQVSHGLRLIVGITVGFTFYYLNQFFGPLVLLFHWPPLLGAFLPILIFGVLGMVLLKIQKQ